MAAPGLSHFEDPAAARWEERECSSLELREVARPGLRRLWHASASPYRRRGIGDALEADDITRYRIANGARVFSPSVVLKLSGSEVTPASLLQFHEPDDAGFDDLGLRNERDIFRLTSCHTFASIPACRKGEVWHGFAHGLDARFDGRGAISQHVQSGSKGDHFDLNLLADLAVMLSHIAHVIEGETHNGGVIDVDLHSQPMRLLLVVGSADFGRSIDFGGSADLRAQHQGERNGGHSSEDGE
jgi:hypothetical protein